MLIARYESEQEAGYGIVTDEKVFEYIGDPFDPQSARQGELIGTLDEVRLLAPVMPGKILAIGKNYAAHAAEFGGDVPAEPLVFMKPPSAVINPGDEIEILPEMGRVDYEAELVVVIGRRGRFVKVENALDHVLGYTCANDVTERDYQKADGQWTRAKGFDTFCPLGPWINTDLDPFDVVVSLRLNGEVKQSASTANMVFDVPHLIAHLSRVMTLEPGDIIMTGTPEGVGRITPGDEVEVEVEGIGVLKNHVVLRQA
ncbi:MAG: fumarylacetoacetate hydrolase family protein [Anaerolineae bacterium]|nr:fumarylacetoacetate hydrolase family protein [Anaerolineae bacterium]